MELNWGGFDKYFAILVKNGSFGGVRTARNVAERNAVTWAGKGEIRFAINSDFNGMPGF